ncbi:hypothetical protein DFH09DRAFT_1080134 [Mycena vulgaris]|nr:hypothetical protein DFH09DRAFT_1080134 [Mycena vulgaris]
MWGGRRTSVVLVGKVRQSGIEVNAVRTHEDAGQEEARGGAIRRPLEWIAWTVVALRRHSGECVVRPRQEYLYMEGECPGTDPLEDSRNGRHLAPDATLVAHEPGVRFEWRRDGIFSSGSLKDEWREKEEGRRGKGREAGDGDGRKQQVFQTPLDPQHELARAPGQRGRVGSKGWADVGISQNPADLGGSRQIPAYGLFTGDLRWSLGH